MSADSLSRIYSNDEPGVHRDGARVFSIHQVSALDLAGTDAVAERRHRPRKLPAPAETGRAETGGSACRVKDH